VKNTTILEDKSLKQVFSTLSLLIFSDHRSARIRRLPLLRKQVRMKRNVRVPNFGVTLAPTLAAALLTTLPGLASPIVTLPVPTSGAECISVSGVVVDTTTGCSDGGGTAAVTLSPFAAVTASASAPPGMSAGADASVNYDFEVVGGNPGDAVPLLITANLTTFANSTSAAYASIFIAPGLSSLGGTQVVACTNEALCTQPADFSGSIAVSVQSGSVNSLGLEVISGDVSSEGAENSSASADPLIVVDPSFANASEYSIVLSPGVANAVGSAAPEPGSGFLVIGALGVLAGRKRIARRRT
jgi:hypothetical protein